MKSFFAKLLGISQQVWDFLIPLVTKQVSITLAKLLPVALSIVTELAKDNDLSGKQKRDKAFKDLTAFAKAEGLDAANSLLNLTIEMAVTKLKVASE
jgi:hypothetical protein